VNKKLFRILALAGSLRQGSYNRGLLRAAAELAPKWVEVQFFDIGTLPFFNEDVEAAALDQLVREGKIRYVGVSNYDVKQMQAFEQVRKLDSLQPPYSLFRRDIEQDILPYTEQVQQAHMRGRSR
jgi:aryl-alcohol dehydrogenase-like predicted oxidoreductase